MLQQFLFSWEKFARHLQKVCHFSGNMVQAKHFAHSIFCRDEMVCFALLTYQKQDMVNACYRAACLCPISKMLICYHQSLYFGSGDFQPARHGQQTKTKAKFGRHKCKNRPIDKAVQ